MNIKGVGIDNVPAELYKIDEENAGAWKKLFELIWMQKISSPQQNQKKKFLNV